MERWRNTKARRQMVDLALQPGQKLAVFDTETTGLPRKGSPDPFIIQFSGMLLEVMPDHNVKELETLDLYLDPEIPIPAKITELTGIREEDVKGKGNTKQNAPVIFAFLAKADVWIGYNLSFDSRMISIMGDRVGEKLPYRYMVDVLEMSRDILDLESYKLSEVYRVLFPDKDVKFHDSMQDVIATFEVFKELASRYDACKEAEQNTTTALVKKASGWVNPHRPSQQRLRLTLVVNDGGGERETKPGEIFYDVVRHSWSCLSNKAATTLFHSLDMEDVEAQTLSICSNRYATYRNMDTLAKARVEWFQKVVKK